MVSTSSTFKRMVHIVRKGLGNAHPCRCQSKRIVEMSRLDGVLIWIFMGKSIA